METIVEQSGIPHPSFQECWSTSTAEPTGSTKVDSSLPRKCRFHLGFGLEDGPEESIRAAVGRAYCLGDQDLQDFCKVPWDNGRETKKSCLHSFN